MKTSIIIAAAFMVLAAPLGASAQSIGSGAEEGASRGNRAAGPIGGLVGGVVGGAVGGAEGGVRGVLGVPRRPYYHRHCFYRHGERFCR